MSDEDFFTSPETQALADEVACLKMMVTLILKGMGQADAGKVIINMERYVKTLGENPRPRCLVTPSNKSKRPISSKRHAPVCRAGQRGVFTLPH